MTIPAPSKDGSGNGSPFLKVMHVNAKGLTAVNFLGKPVQVTDGEFGQQLLVPVSIGKKEYTFAVKIDSGNHARLFAKFGSNEKKWKGKVNVQVAEFRGNEYVQVAD